MENLSKQIVVFIKNYVEGAHSKGVVIGMSGGKDSFVACKLCVLALGKENVFGVIMPNGKMTDLEIAKKECELLGIRYKVVNIENLYNETIKLTQNILETKTLSEVSTINIAPRLRMNILYSVAGTLGYLVANTSNLSETMIGYSTKWGDGVGDFAPLQDLTKTEVCELGLSLGLPENFVNKVPDDGLSGKTDEEKLGFSYAELDDFIRNGNKGTNFDKIQRMHTTSNHKRVLTTKFKTKRKNYFE